MFSTPLIYTLVLVSTISCLSDGLRANLLDNSQHGRITYKGNRHHSTSDVSNLVNALYALANETQYNGVMAARGPTLQDSDLLASLGFGSRDMQGFLPNDPDNTRFPVASNTKLMTSIIIFQLQEQGIIDIHDDVADHLTVEDFQKWGLPSMTKFCMSLYNDPSNTCQKITFEMLLGMTAGITAHVAAQPLLQFVPLYINIAMMWGLQCPMLTLAFTPGTAYTYSNQNYMLLGYFIEKFTGLELGVAYKTYIFDPLGMSNSYFDRTNGLFAFDPLRTEEGFRYFLYDAPTNALQQQLGTGKCQNDIDAGPAQGAGGVISTLKDEATLYYCLFDMTYGDDAPNPHCPFNSSLAANNISAFNILSMASRQKIIAPYAYMSDPLYSPNFVGPTYYAMGMFVSNNTGPYMAEIDQAIVVRGPVPPGPSPADSTAQYPDFVIYVGGFMCANTANFMSLSNRVNGSVAFLTQAYESHRALATTDPNAVFEAQQSEEASMFSIPNNFFAAYTAPSISAKIAELL